MADGITSGCSHPRPQFAADGRWTVRQLRHAIGRKAREHREIADAQLGPGSMVPADTFSDPYLLDFLGLHDGHLEADLEAAILRDLEAFLLEVGTGFTFVEREKPSVIHDKDFHLDLLPYHRPLERLVAVERVRRPLRESHETLVEVA